jgi:ubiquinone/menaquinone biosynthesis C-methylase UbiE
MSSPLEIDHLVIPLIDGYTILDVACGWGKWGHLIRTSWYRTIRGKGNTQPKLLIGVDLFLPSLRRVKQQKIYDDLVLCNCTNLPFRNKSFDVVLSIEIIEHITKPQGKLLLQEIERITQNTVIVSTPNKPKEREGTESPEGFNPYDAHVSSWNAQEFQKRNYTVVGAGFCINGESVPLIKTLFATIAYFLPFFGCYIVATKKCSGNPKIGQILRRLYPI